MQNLSKAWGRLGPGLLFAAAAIGVSHLVLSTQAGGQYGFGLLWLLFLANLAKYPFFEFALRYAQKTGKSLLQGYQELGQWVLLLFIGLTLGTMFSVQAAVSFVSAALAGPIFGLNQPLYMSAGLLVFAAAVLLLGRYKLLDQLMKYMVFSLSMLTLLALIRLLFRPLPEIDYTPFFSLEAGHLAFIIAFVGWMPAPLDLSVWQSIWTLEKKKNQADFGWKEAQFDFQLGYGVSVFLAICFMALGAILLGGSDFPQKAVAFAQQLLKVYEAALGPWAALWVSWAAFICMFSTLITCLDALSRTMAQAMNLAFPKQPFWHRQGLWIGILIGGALLIIFAFLQAMGQLIFIATALSFLSTPFFAWANSRLAFGLPKAEAPSPPMRYLAYFAGGFLLLFCGLYLFSLLR